MTLGNSELNIFVQKKKGVIMLYRIINSESLRFKRTVLIYLLIISYLSTFSSCMTTESLTVSPDSLRSDSSSEIAKIKLKNGTSIDLKNKKVEIINKTDTALVLNISANASRESTGLESNEMIIPLKDILAVQLNRSETNVPLTILLIAGIVIVAGGLIGLAIFSSGTQSFSFTK